MFVNLIDTKVDRCVVDVQCTQGESHLQVLRVWLPDGLWHEFLHSEKSKKLTPRQTNVKNMELSLFPFNFKHCPFGTCDLFFYWDFEEIKKECLLGVGCETEHPFESLLRSVGFDDILDNLAAHWTYSSSPSLPLLQSTLVAEAHMAAPRKEIILNISTYQHYVVTEMCHESDVDLSANLWRFWRHWLTSSWPWATDSYFIITP